MAALSAPNDNARDAHDNAGNAGKGTRAAQNNPADQASHPYAQPAYARANLKPGAVLFAIEPWHTTITKRPIDGRDDFDLAGNYPILPFPAAADIDQGLATLRASGAVSFVCVTDPCAPPPLQTLTAAGAHVTPFKQHFIHRFRQGAPVDDMTYDKETRRKVRKSRSLVTVEQHDFTDPALRQQWCALYGDLMARHAVPSHQQFAPEAFDALAEVSGLYCFATHTPDGVNAMILFLQHNGVAYGHLAGVLQDGYRTMSQYALYDHALRFFSQDVGCHLFNLGGVPGHEEDTNHGLARFKRSFSTETMTSHIIGMVLDQKRYDQLSAGIDGNFFPRYRTPKG